ncbi:hypothetical protein FHS91_003393 [Sphingobium xanthum]|jgi:hypothetical protein
MARPIPMIDDIALDQVAWVRQRTRQRIVSLPILGLEGDVQQKLGRGSHEVELAGVLFGGGAAGALATLQEKAKTGAEVSFTADIVNALELEKMVLLDAEFSESAGMPDMYQYRLALRESPPLPEPAELSSFGGLDGFDVGFDMGALGDVMGDIAAAAGEIQGAIEAATEVLGAIQSIAGLADLAVGNPLSPLLDAASGIAATPDTGSATDALGALLGGD